MDVVSTKANLILPADNESLLLSETSSANSQNEIQKLFEKCMSKDFYNNCIMDFSAHPEINDKKYKHILQSFVFERVQNQDGCNHLIVKVAQNQSRVYKCIMNNGFELHHSEHKTLVVKRCLGHDEKDCAYPPYKTMSLGITVREAKIYHDLSHAKNKTD